MDQIGMIKINDPQMIGLSINQFALKYNRGTYLIRASRHALAVKDGAAYDVQKDPTKKRVKEVWQKIAENKLPHDWQEAQLHIQRREQRIGEGVLRKQKEKKRQENYKKTKIQLKEIRKTPQYQLEQLLKRKKQWVSKLKKAQTYLKKVERSIKRAEKKIQLV
jgi:multidrug resistance efflux pump